MSLKFNDLFTERDEKRRTAECVHKVKKLEMTDLGFKWLGMNQKMLEARYMRYLPMVVEPMDWVSPTKGGYYDEAINQQYGIIKGYSKKKTRALYERSPEGFHTLMEVLNTLQKVPYTVNKTVWEAVKYIHENEINLDTKGMPTYMGGWEATIGKEKSEELFALKKALVRDEDNHLTEESKELLLTFAKSVIEGSDDLEEGKVWKEWKRISLLAVKHRDAEMSKRLLLDNTLFDSEIYINAGVPFYYVYNVDWRGRIYPLTGFFSPQGSDVSKGLLDFANPVWVDTDEAVNEIAIVIANNYGEDKISLEDRIQWTHDHTAEIVECAIDFKSKSAMDFWTKADKPFMFLNSCLEWLKFYRASNNGEGGFYSTLPIAYDGSCNGIQHYSAMFRDTVGAKAVNLVNSDLPSDVYQEVANEALRICKASKRINDKEVVELNKKLDGKLFSRKAAKRTVMCVPYGVGEKSSNAYVFEIVDEALKGVDVPMSFKKMVRKVVAKRIWDSVLTVVSKPNEAKKYLQSVVSELAKDNQGVRWVTPTGFPVEQKETQKVFKSVFSTFNGQQKKRQFYVETSDIHELDQANAIAPNFVHSFDSAHLQMTIKESTRQGMTNFLVVHDSFATDANSASHFNEIIRQQFVAIYDDRDYLNEFHDSVEEQLGRPLVTPRTKQGDFDVQETLDSTYFFA